MPSTSSERLWRLGSALLLGMAAGYGARYVATRLTKDTPSPPLDWAQARRVALSVSRGEGVADRAHYQALYAHYVARSEPLIAAYVGTSLPQPVERVYVLDRREWLEVNFRSLRELFAPVEDLIARLGKDRGPLQGRLGGAQLGLLLGFLARRVLGQYDLSLLSPDPEMRGSLLFVEPNIARVQRELGLRGGDFRLWITLHELTHAFEFEAHPWVRAHFAASLQELIAHLSRRLTSGERHLPQLFNLVRGRGRHWLERLLRPEERALFDRLQALMSLVEGYAEHVMNAIGRELLPSFGEIERRVRERQRNRPLLEELFDRLSGMDLKRAQYRQGAAFVDAVVAARGLAFLNRVWEGPEHLPTRAEISNPQRWIARLGG